MSIPKALYIHPDRLEQSFRELGPRIAVTYGRFELPAGCSREDLDWNHMDQAHRPWIHRTYGEELRIANGKDFLISVTKASVFGIPFLVQVSNFRIGPGLFYQSYSLFNVIQVHAVVRSQDFKSVGERYIVSHRILKFLHKYVDRRLERMNEVQNREDESIRLRRAGLRNDGYRFVHEEHDYLSSNQMTNNVIYPKLGEERTVATAKLKSGALNSVRLGPVELVIRPEENRSFAVWLGACPHEGGPLGEGRACDTGDELQCPWHGLKFRCTRMSESSPRASLGPFRLELSADASELRLSE